ncbi:MAG: hypothetical protein H0T68_14920 [Gemmatimonadales bacterium]|nr:hypothetical protein [Gemmatimonadales bacterium]
MCDAAPRGWVGRCYEGVGLQLTGVFQRDDSWIIEQCATGQPELAPRCAAGATVALTAMDWSGTRAAGFCAASPVAWKAPCYRAAATMLAVFASPVRQAEVCGSIEGKYAEACRQGAALDSPA